MADSTIDITDPRADFPKFLKIVDNGDGTYSIPVSGGLSVPPHDKVEMTYTGSDLTGVVYKMGATTLMTLTLVYSGSNLISVTKA